MKYLLLVLMACSLTSCSTVATQSSDGRTLRIRGVGSAKFENGAEVSRSKVFEFPKIEVDK